MNVPDCNHFGSPNWLLDLTGQHLDTAVAVTFIAAQSLRTVAISTAVISVITVYITVYIYTMQSFLFYIFVVLIVCLKLKEASNLLCLYLSHYLNI